MRKAKIIPLVKGRAQFERPSLFMSNISQFVKLDSEIDVNDELMKSRAQMQKFNYVIMNVHHDAITSFSFLLLNPLRYDNYT